MSNNIPDVRRLTTPQRQLLKVFLTYGSLPSSLAGEYVKLTGKTLGGTLSSLVRRHFIVPIGRNADGSLNYKVNEVVANEKDALIKLMDEIDKDITASEYIPNYIPRVKVKVVG